MEFVRRLMASLSAGGRGEGGGQPLSAAGGASNGFKSVCLLAGAGGYGVVPPPVPTTGPPSKFI